MNGLPRHPGTEEIAGYQAGVIDGARGDQVAAHLAECSECSSLSTGLERIPLILASVPPPALPPGVESRILAALTAESEARSQRLPGSSSAGSPSSSRPAAGGHPRAWLRQRVIAPLGVLVTAAACLILAFAGLRLSGQSHPGGPAVAGRGPVRASGNAISGGVAGPRQNSTSPVLRQPPFSVLVSSANFRSATLQAQVRRQIATGPGGDDQIAPTAALVGCVARLADGARLILVEEASYQSRPVYVIATAGHAWVVARQCTRSDPAVLASVALSPGR